MPDDSNPHSQQETTPIHGLSASDIRKLSESCIEAKGRAYCKYTSSFTDE